MVNLDAPRLERVVFRSVFIFLFATLLSAMAIFLLRGMWWLVAVIAILIIFVCWATLVEPWLVHVARYKIPFVKEPRTWLKIAFVSDLHADDRKRRPYYQMIVKKIEALKPDVLLLGGDVVEEESSAVEELQPFEALTASLGKWFVLGNHDFFDNPGHIRSRLSDWGFKDATNKEFLVGVGDRRLRLVGVDDCYFGNPQFNAKRVDDVPRVLLMHEPDNLLDIPEGSAELALLGHTHGGQIRLPWLNHIVPIPQRVSQSFNRGLRRWGTMPVIISHGLGESSFGARFFCRPQIVLVEVGV
ncbi:MAG: metallophosphoesterase [bacterium]|nr:metallophosphoesterase [bacterium]